MNDGVGAVNSLFKGRRTVKVTSLVNGETLVSRELGQELGLGPFTGRGAYGSSPTSFEQLFDNPGAQKAAAARDAYSLGSHHGAGSGSEKGTKQTIKQERVYNESQALCFLFQCRRRT